MKKIPILVLLFVMMTLTGCETTKGIGRDIENTGQNIQEGLQKIGQRSR